MSLSLPSGSAYQEAINTFYYLSGTDPDINGKPTSDSGWKPEADWNGNGLPKKNLSYETIDEKLIHCILLAVPDRNEKTQTIFQQYPDLVSPATGRDLVIGNTATDIWVTFIDEGAGYKNSVGYFFYIKNDQGKHILTNSPNNDGSWYYCPTIIFPNTSRKDAGITTSSGPLMPGAKRKLKGNRSDGMFQNINVGFFLVPDGWKGGDHGVQCDDKPIIHSSPELNPTYDPDNMAKAIQSIVFSNNDTFLICFEDIMDNQDHDQNQVPDFNDLILRIETSPVLDGLKTIQLPDTALPSNVMKHCYDGGFLDMQTDQFSDPNDKNKKYKLVKKITFNTNENRDDYIRSTEFLTYKLKRTVDVSDDCDYQVIETHEFTCDDLNDNVNGDKMKLCTFAKDENDDDETIVDQQYNNTKYQHMVTAQRHENDNMNNQDIEVHEMDLDDNNKKKIVDEPNTKPCNLTRCVLAWGDPHIALLNGKSIMLPNKEMVYNLLTTGKIKINIDCRLFTDHPMPEYRETSFIKYAMFYYEKETIWIDMFTGLNIYINRGQGIENVKKYESNNIRVHDINSIKNSANKAKFLNMLSGDHNILIRIIEICGVEFWCIIYSNYPEYYNEIYIDSKIINMFSRMSGLVCDGVEENHRL
jgi:hypothetical protein